MQPPPINFDLSSDIVEVASSYQNPFQISEEHLPQAITIEVDAPAESIKRKWKIEHEAKTVLAIEAYRTKQTKYLNFSNGSANKEVFQVYDHLAADLLNEVMQELMGQIDRDLD
jgi:hypothetical protein